MICGICLEKLVFDFVPEVVVLESDQINNLIRKGEVDFFYIRLTRQFQQQLIGNSVLGSLVRGSIEQPCGFVALLNTVRVNQGANEGRLLTDRPVYVVAVRLFNFFHGYNLLFP